MLLYKHHKSRQNLKDGNVKIGVGSGSFGFTLLLIALNSSVSIDLVQVSHRNGPLQLHEDSRYERAGPIIHLPSCKCLSAVELRVRSTRAALQSGLSRIGQRLFGCPRPVEPVTPDLRGRGQWVNMLRARYQLSRATTRQLRVESEQERVYDVQGNRLKGGIPAIASALVVEFR